MLQIKYLARYGRCSLFFESNGWKEFKISNENGQKLKCRGGLAR